MLPVDGTRLSPPGRLLAAAVRRSPTLTAYFHRIGSPFSFGPLLGLQTGSGPPR
jgi:hypothetical protein